MIYAKFNLKDSKRSEDYQLIQTGHRKDRYHKYHPVYTLFCGDKYKVKQYTGKNALKNFERDYEKMLKNIEQKSGIATRSI